MMDEHGYTSGDAAVEPGAGLVAALLTPAGRGALAVVGILGPEAIAVVDRLFVPRGKSAVAVRPDGAVCFGSWHGAAGDEDVVVLRRARDRVEIHSHGGLAAPESVLRSLVATGAVRVTWERWLVAAGEPEWAVEVRVALATAGGPKAARILCRQLAGAWPDAWQRLLDVAATGATDALRHEGHRLLRAARVGLRLTRPWRVVLSGAVNAGKSSLVNALVGHARSIVTAVPGTTRDLVETRIVLDGWEVDLVDTAGLRGGAEGVDAVERAGIDRAVSAAAAADLVLRIAPADGGPPPAPAHSRELVVVSKGDLLGTRRATSAVARRHTGDTEGGPPVRSPTGRDTRPPCVVTSAAEGTGLDALAAAIVRRLVPEEHDEPDLLAGAVPVTPWQVETLRTLLATGVP